MTKKESVITAMVLNWDMANTVHNWNIFVKKAKELDASNAFCEVYPMSEFNAQCNHLNPIEIAESVTSAGKRVAIFDANDKFFYMRRAKFESFNTIHDPNCPMSYDWLADFMIEYGDSGFTNISNDVLVKGFIHEYFPKELGNAKFFKKVYDSDNDFLMDDWDDIYHDLIKNMD